MQKQIDGLQAIKNLKEKKTPTIPINCEVSEQGVFAAK